MDLRRDTLQEFVVLEGQVYLVLVSSIEQTTVELYEISIEHVLGHFEERLHQVWSHAAADRVVALDLRESLTAHQEVTAHHVEVAVPQL